MGSGKKGSARLGSHARDTPTSWARTRCGRAPKRGSGGPRSLDGRGRSPRRRQAPIHAVSRHRPRRHRGPPARVRAGRRGRPRRRPTAARRGHVAARPSAPTSVKATSWSPRRAARMATSSRSAMSGPRSLTSRYVMTAAAYARPASSSRSRSRSASPRLFWAIPAFSRSPTSWRGGSPPRSAVARIRSRRQPVHPGEVDLAGPDPPAVAQLRVDGERAVGVLAAPPSRRPAAGRRSRGCSSAPRRPTRRRALRGSRGSRDSVRARAWCPRAAPRPCR